MRVLVTGGAGYLGSILTRKLLDGGHRVRVIDNFLYGREPLREVEGNPDLQIVRGDIKNIVLFSEMVTDTDAVIHLASIVGDQAGSMNPKATIMTNYLATKNLAEISRLYDVKKFLFASTCSVYGDASTDAAMREDDLLLEGVDFFKGSLSESPGSGGNTAHPISLYGETKLRSEAAIRSISGPRSAILRLGTLFGMSPRMRFDLVINLFIAKALSNEKLTVFGGDQYRPFLHVQDAADAFINLLNSEANGVFNVAYRNVKIIDVAKIVSEKTGAEIEISEEIQDKRNYIVSTDSMKKLGIIPKMTIEDAIIEISDAFDRGIVKDYKENKYSNYKSLFKSKKLQKKVYSLGPIGERTPNEKY